LRRQRSSIRDCGISICATVMFSPIRLPKHLRRAADCL
jgi:hypothetical protein